MKELQWVIPFDALLTWKRKYHGYVAPSWHHFSYPPFWRDAPPFSSLLEKESADARLFFLRRGGGEVAVVVRKLTDFALAYSRVLF